MPLCALVWVYSVPLGCFEQCGLRSAAFTLIIRNRAQEQIFHAGRPNRRGANAHSGVVAVLLEQESDIRGKIFSHSSVCRCAPNLGCLDPTQLLRLNCRKRDDRRSTQMIFKPSTAVELFSLYSQGFFFLFFLFKRCGIS